VALSLAKSRPFEDLIRLSRSDDDRRARPGLDASR